LLGQPQRDLHGEPIPSVDLVVPVDESRMISWIQPDQEATVRRVHAQNPSLMRHLEQLGFILGARLKGLKILPFDQVTHLQIQKQNEVLVLGPAITGRVFVETL
jgi:DtxR family Mn-dependent transcriptional regulator